MPTDGDPELKQLLSELSYSDELARLRKELLAAQEKLKKSEAPGLGPSKSVGIYIGYYRRECEKAELKIAIFVLRNEIEKLRHAYELACSPEVRKRHEEEWRRPVRSSGGLRPSMSGAGPPIPQKMPPYPEVQANRELDGAIQSLNAKETRLGSLASHDSEWNAHLEATRPPRRVGRRLNSRKPKAVLDTGQANVPARMGKRVSRATASEKSGSPPGDNAAAEAESAIELAQPVEPTEPDEKAGSIPAKSRAADVRNFIKRMKNDGYNINKTGIRIVAGRYNDPRSLEHFQYNIAKATEAAIADYDRVIKMPSADFNVKLEKGRAEIEASRNPKPKARR